MGNGERGKNLNARLEAGDGEREKKGKIKERRGGLLFFLVGSIVVHPLARKRNQFESPTLPPLSLLFPPVFEGIKERRKGKKEGRKGEQSGLHSPLPLFLLKVEIWAKKEGE